jgi:hypothetical protein
MGEFNCRSRGTRILLVKEYDIVPISRLPVLEGQTKRSSTGNILTKEYYYFSYKRKNSNDKLETFIVGWYAGEHFLELLNHAPLELFGIFKSHNEKSNKKENANTLIKKDKWNPLALELFRVINIILMAWDVKEVGTLTNILQEITNNKTIEPPQYLVKSVNTIIEKKKKKRTIYKMLDEFRRKKDIINFKFPLTTKILLGYKDKIEKNFITGINDGE